MDYEMFKEIVTEQFLSHMPKEFKNYKLNVQPVTKVNQTLDGISLIAPDEKGKAVRPTLYLNHMYQDYQKSGSLQETIKAAAFQMASVYKEMPESIAVINSAGAKDRVTMILINTEQNKEMLEEMPHREFFDLSIVYQYVVDINPNGMQTAMIHNDMADILGMTEKQLYEAAVMNTKRLFPVEIKSMNEVMHDMVKDMPFDDGMTAEELNLLLGDIPPEQSMYVISNDRKIKGAVSMLYEAELHKLAEKINSDLYLLPSSTHEVIAVSAEMGNLNDLAEMVSEINMNQVELEERLSNQVYHYDKGLRKLTVATDTPNKRLDGIVTEPPMIYETKMSR